MVPSYRFCEISSNLIVGRPFPFAQPAVIIPKALLAQRHPRPSQMSPQAYAMMTPYLSTPPWTWFGPSASNQQQSQPTVLLEIFNTLSLNYPSNNDWFMDSGATTHLHSEAGILHKFSDRIACSFVLVGDGSKIVASNMGDTDLSLYNPYHPLYFKNVLITSNIIKNLICVRQFTNDNSCSIEFDPYGSPHKTNSSSI